MSAGDDRAGARVAPGATVGVLGGGQLGRMLAVVARRMGFEVDVLAPDATPPAAAHASRHVRAAYDDVDAVRAFAAEVDVLTFEFENVSSTALEAAAAVTVVRPGPAVLHTTQHRGREKQFLADAGVPIAPYRPVARPDGLEPAVLAVGIPCVVKTAGFGYDGKGQVVLRERADAAAFAAALSLAAAGPVVVERLVDLELELSVVAARSAAGEVAVYAPVVNRHVDQVLDLSVTPTLVDAETWAQASRDEGAWSLSVDVASRAQELTGRLFERLGYVGLGCIEFFLTRSGDLLVNEIAPRPHNSGHLTIEAAVTDQFEQQLRAVCGLPLGSTRSVVPAAMANLLGDLWADGEPDFAAALRHEGVALHLYGKTEARPGRKMGHLTATAPTAHEAVATVLAARRAAGRTGRGRNAERRGSHGGRRRG